MYNVFTPPVVIGGKGGSGTRVFCEILQKLGLYMGDLAGTMDAMEFVSFIHRYYVIYFDSFCHIAS